MGLLDNVLGGQSSQATSLDPREAFIAVSNRMELFKDQSPNQFNNVMDKLFGLLRKHGPEPVLEKSVAGLPDELRDTPFAVAADLVFADGSIEDEERLILESLQASLGVEEETAIKIIEILKIKNAG